MIETNQQEIFVNWGNRLPIPNSLQIADILVHIMHNKPQRTNPTNHILIGKSHIINIIYPSLNGEMIITTMPSWKRLAKETVQTLYLYFREVCQCCKSSPAYLQWSMSVKRKQIPVSMQEKTIFQHNGNVIMSTMAYQITSLSIVCSTVCSGADHRNHHSSVSLAFVRGIHRWPVNSSHKWPVTRKMLPFDDVIMKQITYNVSKVTRR